MVGSKNAHKCYFHQHTLQDLFSLSPAVPDSYRVCNTGELRLVTDNTVTTSLGQGRVELCSEHGLWGTVCDNKWDSRDARVVCRELRFNGTGMCVPTQTNITSSVVGFVLQ